jgi:hypothetical protein
VLADLDEPLPGLSHFKLQRQPTPAAGGSRRRTPRWRLTSAEPRKRRTGRLRTDDEHHARGRTSWYTSGLDRADWLASMVLDFP